MRDIAMSFFHGSALPAFLPINIPPPYLSMHNSFIALILAGSASFSNFNSRSIASFLIFSHRASMFNIHSMMPSFSIHKDEVLERSRILILRYDTILILILILLPSSIFLLAIKLGTSSFPDLNTRAS